MLVASESYYAEDEPALQQGDILLAPIGRIEKRTTDGSVGASRWNSSIEGRTAPLPVPAEIEKHNDFVPLQSAHGIHVVMVTMHDCHMVKEMERAYEKLRNQGVAKKAAMAQAEADPDLDRFITVSPLIPTAHVVQSRNQVEAGKALGIFPVFDRSTSGVPEGAIDLGYQSTIDRHTIIARLAVLSEEARTALRYALARTFALRTPTIGFQLQHLIGQEIYDIRPDATNQAVIVLELENGSEMRFIVEPDPVDPEGLAHQV